MAMTLNNMLDIYAAINGVTDDEQEDMTLLFKHTDADISPLSMETLARTIIVRHGTWQTPVSRTEQYRFVHETFFLKHSANIKKMATALEVEYNPIENYNRMEDFTDVNSGTSKNTGERRNEGGDSAVTTDSGTDKTTTKQNGNTVSTTDVSAYNDANYAKDNRVTNIDTSQPETTTVYGKSNTTKTTLNNKTIDDLTRTDDFTNKRTGRTHGNIGVTTTQQMLTQELELRKVNLYNTIADMYASECLLGI